MRLLLIEDEKLLCDSIAKRLRRIGYSVDVCYDGAQALDFLSVEPYDLVLLDLNLPQMDGMTVLRTFRKAELLCAARNHDYLFASAHGRPPACGIALRK